MKKTIVFFCAVILITVSLAGCTPLLNAVTGTHEFYDEENDAIIVYNSQNDFYYCRFSDLVELAIYGEDEMDRDYLQVQDSTHSFASSYLTENFTCFCYDKHYIYILKEGKYYVFDRSSVPDELYFRISGGLDPCEMREYNEKDFFAAYPGAERWGWFGRKHISNINRGSDSTVSSTE